MNAKVIIAAAAASTLAALSAHAGATVLSVNFETNYQQKPVSAGPAGVVSEPAAQWNNVSGDTGTTSVSDDSSNSYSLTWNSLGGWYTAPGSNAAADGNSQLMINAITPEGPDPTTFSLSGLSPSTTYNVYVYVAGLNASNNDQYDTLGGSTTYYADFTQSLEWSGSGPYTFNGFSQVTSTTSSNYQEGNYVEFTGVTGLSTLNFLSEDTSGQSGITGFQIQSTPEPASLALSVLGGAALLARPRRANSRARSKR